MSALPRPIRTLLAARLTEEMSERQGMAADADAGFDAGEFSGPAHDRLWDLLFQEICMMCRVRCEPVQNELSRREHNYGESHPDF